MRYYTLVKTKGVELSKNCRIPLHLGTPTIISLNTNLDSIYRILFDIILNDMD
jgi:hypothetical protein